MSRTDLSGTATRTGDWSRSRAALPALCLTQITSWGVVYYAFPVLSHRIAADTGWSTAAITAAFSLGLLVSAAVGIPIGRILDRRGPRAVMTGGSILAVTAMVAVASAPNLAMFTAAWSIAGVAMATTLYQPAFAALTRWYGPHRVRALTTLTLAGGLASTVFAPTTAALEGQVGWRGAYIVLAVVLAVVTNPAHALALRAPRPSAPAHKSGITSGRDSIARTRPFILLAGALTLSGFAVYAVVIGLVPLLTARGASTTTAAWALGLGGLGQTLGRTLRRALSVGDLAADALLAVHTGLVVVLGLGYAAVDGGRFTREVGGALPGVRLGSHAKDCTSEP